VNALASAKWTDIRDRPLVLIPIGSIEQHGPHLPLETDAVIAEAVAKRVAQMLEEEIYVAPVLNYTASGEHQMFAGTCSIGIEALRTLIVELVRSVRTWSGRVVLVNAHGGNVEALADAVNQLVDEGHDVGWLPCATEHVDAHAGFTETSLMMHLQPWSVRFNQIEVGNTEPIVRLLPVLIRAGVGAVSPNGVLGDPRAATAQEGARCLEAMATEIAGAIRDGRPDGRGVLRSAAVART
jgi:mycofactocin system creatininase family protein